MILLAAGFVAAAGREALAAVDDHVTIDLRHLAAANHEATAKIFWVAVGNNASRRWLVASPEAEAAAAAFEAKLPPQTPFYDKPVPLAWLAEHAPIVPGTFTDMAYAVLYVLTAFASRNSYGERAAAQVLAGLLQQDHLATGRSFYSAGVRLLELGAQFERELDGGQGWPGFHSRIYVSVLLALLTGHSLVGVRFGKKMTLINAYMRSFDNDFPDEDLAALAKVDSPEDAIVAALVTLCGYGDAVAQKMLLETAMEVYGLKRAIEAYRGTPEDAEERRGTKRARED